MTRLPTKWSKGLITLLAIAVAFVLLVTLFGRGSEKSADFADQSHSRMGQTSSTASMNKAEEGSAYTMASAAPAAEAPMPAPAYAGDAALGGTTSDYKSKLDVTYSEAVTPPIDRKIINEGSVQIETKDFDASIAAIDRMISQSGGFAEMRNVQGSSIGSANMRYASYTFRVPAESFDAIMNNMSTIGNVTQKNTNGTDITDQYIDSEARLKALKVQQQTLLDIMAKAEKLEDVITLESRISEVQYEIESIENQLKNYDRLVQYSRITVNIVEVVEVTEVKPVARTLGDKIAEAFNDACLAFTDGLENFTLWLVANWILLAFFIVIIIVCIILRVRHKRRKQKIINSTPVKKDDESAKE